ncbi:hypothetical protein BC332_14617 [Capsicum chinense]|nr:hypothetical protein BC332_14617 [Capsicum chinense]
MEVIAKTNLRVMDLIAEAQPRVTEVIMEETRGEISASRWADLVDKEERVSPSSLNSRLSPETPAFVPKSANAKKNELEALASKLNAFSSDEDLSEKELNTFASDEDLSEEEEEELEICFEKVARDGDISPRQQRSGSRKNKKKTHGRQHK